MAGAPIERETMQHVAKTVAGVDLSDHIVNVVFVLFDENGDGKVRTFHTGWANREKSQKYRIPENNGR